MRSKSEFIEMERLLIESVSIARETFSEAVKKKDPCANEATEWLASVEEELLTFRQFKDKTKEVIEGGLREAEEKFVSDLAEVLMYQGLPASGSDNLISDEEIDKILSPALAYDKFGHPKSTRSAHQARVRAHLLVHRKFILEWLLKKRR